VAPIAIQEDKLNKLYDYDYAFVSAVLQLDSDTGALVYDPANPNSIQASISQFTKTVGDIKQKWSVRMEAIEGIAIH
jgi:hypothetical protein